MLRTALQIGHNAQALPETVCPVLRSGMLAISGRLVCDAILLLSPGEEEKGVVTEYRDFLDQIREQATNHAILEHTPEGVVAEGIPDDIAAMLAQADRKEGEES